MDARSMSGGDGRGGPGGPRRGASQAPGAGGLLDHGQLQLLRELGGEDEPDLVLDLIELFLSDAHDRLEEMRAALARGDHQAIARAAHTLKSSSGSMGAMLLSQLCREVEELARTCAGSDLEARAESCFEAYAQTEQALRRLEE